MYSVCKVTLLRFIIAKLYFFREIMSKKKNLRTLHQVSRLDHLMMEQSYISR